MSKNLRTLLQKSIKNLFRIQNSIFLDFLNLEILDSKGVFFD